MTKFSAAFSLLLLCAAVVEKGFAAWTNKEDDLVVSLPGFEDNFPSHFQVYSGYLQVPGPFEQNDYDALSIHYQFHTSQSNTSEKDPVVTWHQGGPGGSSIAVGLYTEMGYFITDDHGAYVNEYAWNKVANMLYLESPAGSGGDAGFSTCVKSGKPVKCKWDDRSQAEAYGHTLAAFYKKFPEFASNSLYLTGESYFGQYGPNIAAWILNQPNRTVAGVSLPLEGIALGNACWGGTENKVQCNGPNSQQNDADMYFGKGLSSKKLYDEIYKTCDFPKVGLECEAILERQSLQVGPHDVYNIYDNCPNAQNFLAEHNATMRQLLLALRSQFDTPNDEVSQATTSTHRRLLEATMTGGYAWSCGGEDAAETYLTRDDVMKALHISNPGESGFGYETSGPASITLYPDLVRQIRVFIYNGDADSCVPYKGNEEWITSLETAGVLKEKKSWHPWYGSEWPGMPAGYATTYVVEPANDDGSETDLPDFTFVTIRLAGHMVPTFQPSVSLDFFQRFLNGPWVARA